MSAAAGSGPQPWDEATYAELKKIARARLHASGPLTQLNTTALVNESYLRLSARAEGLRFPSPGHYYAYAAKVMRSIIVDLVREQQAEQRGGGARRVTLSTTLADSTPDDDEALHVDEALRALEQVEPRLAQVVEMRYYGGLTEAEIASALGVTDRTVRRDWDKARAILRSMLG